MPRCHTDELSKLDDIQSLIATARDLALRFKGPELHTATRHMQTVLEEISQAREAMLDGWREARL